MEILYKIYTDIGPWGLLFVVLIFIVLRGQLSFKYPRPSGKSEDVN